MSSTPGSTPTAAALAKKHSKADLAEKLAKALAAGVSVSGPPAPSSKAKNHDIDEEAVITRRLQPLGGAYDGDHATRTEFLAALHSLETRGLASIPAQRLTTALLAYAFTPRLASIIARLRTARENH